MKKRFTEEQIVAILRDGESGQKSAGEVCRKHAVSVPTGASKQDARVTGTRAGFCLFRGGFPVAAGHAPT